MADDARQNAALRLPLDEGASDPAQRGADALFEQGHALSLVLAQLPIGITVWDRHYRNAYANNLVEERFGWNAAWLRGKHLTVLIGQEAWELNRGRLDAVLAGQAQSFQSVFPHGGRLHHRYVQLQPLRDADGQVHGCIVLAHEPWHDEQRAAAQRAMAESERRFRLLAEASPLGVFQTDDKGSCTYTNARWQALYDMSLEASLGDGWTQGVHPDDREELVAQWHATTAARGDEFAHTYRVRRADGTLRHVRARARALQDDAGRIEGFVGTVEDITAAHVAQERLRELYERTPVMMHSIDTSGMLLTVSDRWLDKMGYRRDEVIGRRGLEFFAREKRALRERELATLWQTGRHVSGVHQVLRKDGTPLDIVVSAIVQRDDAGRPLRALVVSDDVTELLERTAELQREQTQRAEVERQAAELNALLAERSEMLDVLAHEVRQPLNNASAALQSAAAALADPASRTDAAERLRRAQGVMHGVLSGVDNTLAVSALVGGNAPAATLDDDADIDALLAVAIGDMPPHERARVRIERATDTRTASMDPGLMRLALRNLLANALHHTPPGRAVTLRVSDSDAPLALVIEVIDQGVGIAPALLPRLFERGARGRDRSGRASHGLGLYIVRRALELQGGRAELAATGPAGTTMRLWLAQAGASGARNT